MVSQAKGIDNYDLSETLKIIPDLTPDRYKGQNGKVAVVGGSFDYTGAPYYAGISALKGGGDLSHIFCTEMAGIPIKCYSPELIVHNSLVSSEKYTEEEFDQKKKDEAVAKITKWFDAMHTFVLGPGLGRDPILGKYLHEVLAAIKDKSTVVFDGDMLWYLSDSTERKGILEVLKKIAPRTVLTPNKVEFSRLCKTYLPEEQLVPDVERSKAKKDIESTGKEVIEVDLGHPYVVDAVKLSKVLYNATVCYKGEFDVITDGKRALVVKQQGAKKRCGGQGDIFSGLMGLYVYWSNQFWEKEVKSDDESRVMRGCVLASVITRLAANKAYQKHQYGLTTPLIIEQIPDVIDQLASSK